MRKDFQFYERPDAEDWQEVSDIADTEALVKLF